MVYHNKTIDETKLLLKIRESMYGYCCTCKHFKESECVLIEGLSWRRFDKEKMNPCLWYEIDEKLANLKEEV